MVAQFWDVVRDDLVSVSRAGLKSVSLTSALPVHCKQTQQGAVTYAKQPLFDVGEKSLSSLEITHLRLFLGEITSSGN